MPGRADRRGPRQEQPPRRAHSMPERKNRVGEPTDQSFCVPATTSPPRATTSASTATKKLSTKRPYTVRRSRSSPISLGLKQKSRTG